MPDSLLPTPWQEGDDLSATALNQLRNGIRAATPRSSKTMKIRRGVHGFNMSPKLSDVVAAPARARGPSFLQLTTVAPAGFEYPSEEADMDPEDIPLRVWVNFGTWDGFIPSNLGDPILELDVTDTSSKDYRVWLKATPLTVNGLYVVWSEMTVEKGAGAALYSTTLPDQGALNTTTNLREYYLLSIGVVRWVWTPAVPATESTPEIPAFGSVSLLNDDNGSIRSYMRYSNGTYTASDSPDHPPKFTYNQDLIMLRGAAIA